VSQSLMLIGGFRNSWQVTTNLFAVLVTMVMLIALPDIRCILLPPSVPAVVGSAALSPYQLWVSLATKHADYFRVVFESHFWSNRRAELKALEGPGAHPRAEMRLSRLPNGSSHDVEEGTVWVERRRRFLTRELAPGERVGRYTLAYLNRLGRQ
jgi:hypothetical protein